MFEHVREYVIVDCRTDKPFAMDRNVHDVHQYRSGNDGDTDLVAKILRDIRNMSPRRQLITGAALGFVSGFLVTKTGKYVCIVIGTSVIVLQLATQNDYIKFNLLRSLSYEEVRRPGSNTDNRRVRSVRPFLARFFQQLHTFLVDQPNLTSGVIGGFLIGLGFS